MTKDTMPPDGEDMADSRGMPLVDSERWAAVFDSMALPSYIVDIVSLELVGINRAMRARVGDRWRLPCHQAIYQLDRPCPFCPIATLAAPGRPLGVAMTLEYFNEADDRWYQLHEAMLDWIDGRRVKYSIAVDITALKAAQNDLAEAHAELALKSRQLQKAAVTDRLTGLSNRRRLDEVFGIEVERVLRYQGVLSVIMADIDRFKLVNDTYGHQAGDEVLIALAGLLTEGSRRVDTVGRWGGEEFMIICPGTDLAGGRALAEKLREEVAGFAFPVAGNRTASFGVAQLRPGETVYELVSRVDGALYRAKAAGRNRVESDPPE